MFIYPFYNHNWRNRILVLFIYITRLASNEIFSPSNKIHWEIGRDKDLVLSPTRKETNYSDRRLWCSCILFIIITGGILVLFIYMTRLASNEIFLPSNKIHREVGRAKDLSAPLYYFVKYFCNYNSDFIADKIPPLCSRNQSLQPPIFSLFPLPRALTPSQQTTALYHHC